MLPGATVNGSELEDSPLTVTMRPPLAALGPSWQVIF
jgi:hypothetical protein